MPVPDPTPRGIPRIDASVPVVFHTMYNAQSNALDTALDNLEQDIHDEDSVPTVDDLPETGNWLGRKTLVVADQHIYVITSLPSTWVRLDYLDRAFTNPTMGAGWDHTTGSPKNNLLRRGGNAYLEFNAFRTTNLAIGGTIVDIPPGYRGELYCWTFGWNTFYADDGIGDGEAFQIFYNPAVHKVQTRSLIPAGASLAVSLGWPTL